MGLETNVYAETEVSRSIDDLGLYSTRSKLYRTFSVDLPSAKDHVVDGLLIRSLTRMGLANWTNGIRKVTVSAAETINHQRSLHYLVGILFCSMLEKASIICTATIV